MFFLWFFAVSSPALAQRGSISVSGNWATGIPSSQRVQEAGLDYENIEIESAHNQVYIDLTAIWDWEVHVQCDYSNFLPGCTLQVRRRGRGTFWFIYDGISYQSLNTTPSYFFRGYFNGSNVPIQYKIVGSVSVLDEVKTYEAVVTYTLHD
ncbi:MAG: hypothetical protein CSA95_03675 [Bacteroidetes bacterium]|nr:MAG: hypothetical protein CSA95_03675 [Bacteroidota bacterium]